MEVLLILLWVVSGVASAVMLAHRYGAISISEAIANMVSGPLGLAVQVLCYLNRIDLWRRK